MIQTGQNSAVRTREEQIEFLTRRMRWDAKHEATAYILEAEARGAAEQRRKDAEGQEPVMWQKQHIDGTWSWTTCHDFHEANGTPTRGLYTRPANVAALEARVKELEAEWDKLFSVLRKISSTSGATIGWMRKTARAALTREEESRQTAAMEARAEAEIEKWSR